MRHESVYTFRAMGTRCSLHLFAASEAEAGMLAALAVAEVERIEKKYSRYDENSSLSLINRKAAVGDSVRVDEETAGLIDFAMACFDKSGGLFDISSGILRRAWNFSSRRLPADESITALLPCVGLEKLIWRRPELSFSIAGMELDLGGIGKEYAVDRLASILAAEGVTQGMIDLGGDFFVLGPRPGGAPWKIGLRDPDIAGRLIDTVPISEGALATSGDYERCITIDGRRYSHILDPRTGWPVPGLSSVTVLAPHCMVAGALSTTAILKGSDGVNWLSDLGVSHRWVDDQGRQGGDLPCVPPN